jgi:hypothetical protein
VSVLNSYKLLIRTKKVFLLHDYSYGALVHKYIFVVLVAALPLLQILSTAGTNRAIGKV